MTVVITATGKEFPCDFFAIATGYDVLYLKVAMEPMEAMTVFMNPEETEMLSWYNQDSGEVVRSVTGYTEFGGLDIYSGSCPIRIRMTRPLTQGGTENVQV